MFYFSSGAGGRRYAAHGYRSSPFGKRSCGAATADASIGRLLRTAAAQQGRCDSAGEGTTTATAAAAGPEGRQAGGIAANSSGPAIRAPDIGAAATLLRQQRRPGRLPLGVPRPMARPRHDAGGEMDRRLHLCVVGAGGAAGVRPVGILYRPSLADSPVLWLCRRQPGRLPSDRHRRGSIRAHRALGRHPRLRRRGGGAVSDGRGRPDPSLLQHPVHCDQHVLRAPVAARPAGRGEHQPARGGAVPFVPRAARHRPAAGEAAAQGGRVAGDGGGPCGLCGGPATRGPLHLGGRPDGRGQGRGASGVHRAVPSHRGGGPAREPSVGGRQLAHAGPRHHRGRGGRALRPHPANGLLSAHVLGQRIRTLRPVDDL
eukprot:scaffold3260_cov212-Isochrysis_galbana.AAC.11